MQRGTSEVRLARFSTDRVPALATPASPQQIPSTPQMIDASLAAALQDRYVLERELGRGGMATVYLARDLTR